MKCAYRTPTPCTAGRHQFVRAWWGDPGNPGTWDTGNGGIVTVSVCLHCGIKRRIVDPYVSDSTEEADVTYSNPDPVLAREARDVADA